MFAKSDVVASIKQRERGYEKLLDLSCPCCECQMTAELHHQQECAAGLGPPQEILQIGRLESLRYYVEAAAVDDRVELPSPKSAASGYVED
jgi:hypothetical protein